MSKIRPLTEGYVVKGGRNHGPSQITERPPAPAAIRPAGYPHQPGSPHFDGADAYEAYCLEQMPPEQLIQCDECGGSGIIVRGITVYEHGCGFPHNDTAEDTCEKCRGFGCWVGDAEPDSVTTGDAGTAGKREGE